jgi:hypothetical protein
MIGFSHLADDGAIRGENASVADRPPSVRVGGAAKAEVAASAVRTTAIEADAWYYRGSMTV